MWPPYFKRPHPVPELTIQFLNRSQVNPRVSRSKGDLTWGGMRWDGGEVGGNSRVAGRNAGCVVTFAFQAIDKYFPSVKLYISTISRDLLVPQIFGFTETTFQTYATHRCVHTVHTGKQTYIPAIP